MRNVLDAASPWVGIPYGHPRSRSDRSVIDCSTLTAHIVDELVGLDDRAWCDVVLVDGSRPWSPIDRAALDGWGEEPVMGAPLWDGIYLVQGWRRIPLDGHAMIGRWQGGTFALLQATSRRGADGRSVGVSWVDAPGPARAPLAWADAPAVAWSTLRERYRAGVRCVRLVGAE